MSLMLFLVFVISLLCFNADAILGERKKYCNNIVIEILNTHIEYRSNFQYRAALLYKYTK